VVIGTVYGVSTVITHVVAMDSESAMQHAITTGGCVIDYHLSGIFTCRSVWAVWVMARLAKLETFVWIWSSSCDWVDCRVCYEVVAGFRVDMDSQLYFYLLGLRFSYNLKLQDHQSSQAKRDGQLHVATKVD